MVNGVGVGVMILRDGKVLLGRRNDDPKKADSKLHGEGKWTMPGGKMDFGEGFEDAAFREVLEETGIRINKNKLKLISVTNDIARDAHFITLGFVCEEFEGEPRLMEPDEIVEWRWFDISRPPKPMFSPSEKILKNFVTGEIYRH